MYNILTELIIKTQSYTFLLTFGIILAITTFVFKNINFKLKDKNGN